MRVLGLLCSPRKRGNTDQLLDEFLRGTRDQGADTEKIDASSLQIGPCRGCGACESRGECAITDEMQVVYDRITNADGIVVASPVYFYHLAAQCKILIDRCQAFWSQKYVLNRMIRPKSGFFLSVGATKGEKMFDGAIVTVKYFFDAINATYVGDLFVRGIDGKGAIKNHPAALSDAYEAEKKLFRSVQQMDSARDCGRQYGLLRYRTFSGRRLTPLP